MAPFLLFLLFPLLQQMKTHLGHPGFFFFSSSGGGRWERRGPAFLSFFFSHLRYASAFTPRRREIAAQARKEPSFPLFLFSTNKFVFVLISLPSSFPLSSFFADSGDPVVIEKPRRSGVFFFLFFLLLPQSGKEEGKGASSFPSLSLFICAGSGARGTQAQRKPFFPFFFPLRGIGNMEPVPPLFFFPFPPLWTRFLSFVLRKGRSMLAFSLFFPRESEGDRASPLFFLFFPLR